MSRPPDVLLDLVVRDSSRIPQESCQPTYLRGCKGRTRPAHRGKAILLLNLAIWACVTDYVATGRGDVSFVREEGVLGQAVGASHGDDLRRCGSCVGEEAIRSRLHRVLGLVLRVVAGGSHGQRG